MVFIMSAVNGQVNYMYLGAFIGLIGASMVFQYVCVGLGKGSLNLTRNSIRVSKQKLIRKGEEK
ncbi:MAG: hypothetical protein IJS71_09895 [Clostridia bacterium]|nr:hypothetical protein [Clostridia bacterium]